MAAALIALQNRVEKHANQQVELQTTLHTSKMKTIQSRTQRSPIWDLLIASITIIAIGNFAASNIKDLLAAPLTALPAAIVFALGIFSINLSIRQFILSSELDYAKPIVETQSHLANLRKLRVRSMQWIFISALPLWLIFPILLGQMVIGSKFLLALDLAWVIGNTLFGLVLIPPINWFLKKSKYARSIQDEFAGKDIVEAEAFLKEIQEFRND